MNADVKRIFFWAGITAVLIIIFIGIIQANSSGGGSTAGSLSEAVSSSDHTKGNPDGSVQIVEYSDFQCPACAGYYPLLQDVIEEFGSEVGLTYRHYPLRTIHPKAQIAGQAAEAAAMQGAFWEMHDLLFDNQRFWSSAGNEEELFIGYAEQLGLDAAKFEEDMNSSRARGAVNEDYSSGVRSGVNSTPSLFLNGQRIVNPRNLEEFRIIIRNAINAEAQVINE